MVTAFYCLFLFNAPQTLFRDADTGWHIRTGERILNTLSLPRTDPYSFTAAGYPWVDWEWLSDVLMGAAHEAAGLSGVVWMFVVAIASVTWLWVRFNWITAGNFFITCVLAAPMLSTANLHWLARPHIFGWIFLLLALMYFENAETRFRSRDGIALTVGSALWANMHASFFLLPVIAVIYALSHLVRPLLWKLDPVIERRKARWFGWAAAVSLAGSLLTPYGLALHFHLVEYLADGDLLDRVAEFQSFNFHVGGAWQILAMLGIAAGGGVLALAQKKVAHFLLAALFLAAALRSARGLPIAALILLPLANGAITNALRRNRELRAPLRKALLGFVQYSDRLRLLDARYAGFFWTPFVLLLLFGWLEIPFVKAQTGFSRADFPVEAARAIPKEAHLLAPDKYGGYLIYRFNGSRKVFFDGRSDFYGSGFMKSYIRLLEVRPGWRELLERWHFSEALLPVDYSLVPALEQIGWKELYRDDVAVVLVSPEAAAREQ